MTLTVRDVIKSGNRMLGALATGDDPSADELNDALLAYNTMTRALHGTIIGPRLSPQNLTVSLQAENGGFYQAYLAGAATLTAPLNPRNGARFGAVDAKLIYATNNLTVAPNGRLIEGAVASLVLAIAGTTRVWFFDADTGNWIKEADAATVDATPPYPDRLNAYLPAMFAVYVASQYGADIRQDVVAYNTEGRLAFARNYGRRGRNQADQVIGVAIPELRSAGANP